MDNNPIKNNGFDDFFPPFSNQTRANFCTQGPLQFSVPYDVAHTDIIPYYIYPNNYAQYFSSLDHCIKKSLNDSYINENDYFTDSKISPSINYSNYHNNNNNFYSDSFFVKCIPNAFSNVLSSANNQSSANINIIKYPEFLSGSIETDLIPNQFSNNQFPMENTFYSTQNHFSENNNYIDPYYTNYTYYNSMDLNYTNNTNYHNNDHTYTDRNNNMDFSNNAHNSSTHSIEELQLIKEKYDHQRFPIKLWNLASDENFHPISWSSSGLSLLIDTVKLEPILGYFFRTTKFSSFLRQLHLYGFRKVARMRNRLDNFNIPFNEEHISEYQCHFFQQNKFDLVKKVRRYYSANLSSSKSYEQKNSKDLFPIKEIIQNTHMLFKGKPMSQKLIK